MTDNWDDITELLKKSSPPEASEGAKKLAIEKAMSEFDKKHSPSHQGISFVNRLMDTVKTVCKTIRGEFDMRKAYIVAGGVCVSIFAVGLMSSTYLSQDFLPKEILSMDDKNSNGQNVKNEFASKLTAVASSNIPVSSLALPSSPPPVAVLSESIVDRSGAVNIGKAALPKKMPMRLKSKMLLNYSNDEIESKEQRPAPMLMANKEFRQKADISKKRDFRRVTSSGKAVYAEKSISAGAALSEMDAVSGFVSSVASAPAYGIVGVDVVPIHQTYREEGRDKFESIKENSIKVVKEEPVSTFSVDVDTSSYSFMRASLNNNVLPQKNTVRIEEMINYFPYDYDVPKNKSEPFKANVSVFPTPWNSDTKLMHIGIKGYEIDKSERPHSNLVFLIDTSGSMNQQNKLPLLKNSLKLLLNSLQADDTVAIVTYAGRAGVALEPTKASNKSKILSILNRLGAGGSTAGAQGIKTAYDLAESHFNKNGVNRVILATDGDFNVGITNQEELKSYIERKRKTGVFLSILGFGRGNYNDALMQTLAQNGNGNAAYIDSLSEARKALVEEAGSTLFTIANDVKIQVEFNPTRVAEYRLIGYETRILKREDFNNDKVDAGDIGSGHAVTAIYEITPVGSKARLIDESRYQKAGADKATDYNKIKNSEYAFVKIRYKLPKSNISKLITTPVTNKAEYKKMSEVPVDAKFATSVAAFAQLLRGDSYTASYKYDDVINLAQSAKGNDNFGYRAEFINMVRLVKATQAMKPVAPHNNLPVKPLPHPHPVPYNLPVT